MRKIWAIYCYQNLKKVEVSWVVKKVIWSSTFKVFVKQDQVHFLRFIPNLPATGLSFLFNCPHSCFWSAIGCHVRVTIQWWLLGFLRRYTITRVDSSDPQTSNIQIWRYHCLGEVVFLKIWNQYWLPSDKVHQRFLFIFPAHL